MTLEPLDITLRRLSDAVERIRANLLELDLEADVKLLEEGPLAGETARMWGEAKAAIINLWRWLALLEQLIERATELRGRRRLGAAQLAALRELLQEPSLELQTREVPLAERTLLGDPQATVRCTPDELLERMTDAFETAKGVVTAAGAAWQALIPRVTDARTRLGDCSALADELGGGHRTDLAAARRLLAEVAEQVTRDPLAVSEASMDELVRTLDATRSELESANALRRDTAARLAAARAQLEELATLARQGEEAHARRVSRIVGAEAPQPLTVDPRLDPELARIALLTDGGRWVDARDALQRWTERVEASLGTAHAVVAANLAPIEERNELRALLDAYQSKAGRLGLIEDKRLRGLYDDAHDALYTAPTDVARATELVRAYQTELRTQSSDHEVPR